MKRLRTGNLCLLVLAAGFGLFGILLLGIPGVRFSACLSLALAGLCILWLPLNRWAERSRTGGWFRRICAAGLSLVLLVLGCFEVVIINQGRSDLSALPVDAVIVLGAGVNGETPSVALQSRIDAAADYIAYHAGVPVVLSGGQGPGESITEAEAMYRALQTDDEAWNVRFLLEERSTSTAENFAFSREILQGQGIDPDAAVIGVVTNDFHIARAKLIARRQGFGRVVGYQAELPWWWLNANYYAREAFAMVKTLILD